MSESTRYGMTTEDWDRVRTRVEDVMRETISSDFASSDFKRADDVRMGGRGEILDEESTSTLLMGRDSPFRSSGVAEPALVRDLAVMSVDMRDSSRLTDTDPKSAISFVRGLLSGVVEIAQTPTLRGRVAGFRGDGLILAFHKDEPGVSGSSCGRCLKAAISVVDLMSNEFPTIISRLSAQFELSLDYLREPKVGIGLDFGTALAAVVGGVSPFGSQEATLYGPIVNMSWQAANLKHNRNKVFGTQQLWDQIPTAASGRGAFRQRRKQGDFIEIEATNNR